MLHWGTYLHNIRYVCVMPSETRHFHFGVIPEDGDPPNETKGLPVVAVEVVRLFKEPSRITTTNTVSVSTTTYAPVIDVIVNRLGWKEALASPLQFHT